jgi:hypothetical protein
VDVWDAERCELRNFVSENIGNGVGGHFNSGSTAGGPVTRYSLGFVPAGRAGDSGFHTVKINAHTQAHGKLTARTRTGYFGNPSNKP